jgi:DNA-binding response OmpR family regulator
MRVALLDHDPQQRKTLERLLKATRHECTSFSRPDALKAYLMADVPDLLLLHWPDSDDSAAGLALLSSLREQWPQLALLIIVSRSPGDAALRLLATSPAEVLLKPLRRNELLLRLRLLLDRYRADRDDEEAITYGPYAFFTGLAQLRVGNNLVALTQKEFELALLFFRHVGRPLSRAYIHETVWSRDAELSSRTLDTHVSRVRNKLGLGQKSERGYRLVPVYSFGYRLEQITE